MRKYIEQKDTNGIFNSVKGRVRYFMKQTKRLYERIDINLESNIYIGDKEYTVIIKDISECGVAFLCKDSILEGLIETGAVIQFWSLDSYELFGVVHNDIINGQGRVVRFDNAVSDNSKVIGVALTKPSQSLINYVSNKKVVQFLKEIS